MLKSNGANTKQGKAMKRNCGDWLEAFIAHNEVNKFPTKFLKWAGISAIAGALERKTWVYYRNAQIYPNLYIMLVGPPGSGKSKSANEAMKYLSSVSDIHFTPNMMTQASLIHDLEISGVKKAFQFKNQEYRMSAIFCFASEAVNTLGDNYGSIIKILTDLYDSGANGWHKDKFWHKTTKTSGEEKIFNPCINLLACTTAEWLTDFIDIKDLRGGFSSRCIFVHESSYNTGLIDWKDDEETTSHDASIGINKHLADDLRAINALRGKFKIADEVRRVAPLADQAIAMDLDANPTDKFNHFKVRKFWNIMKVAQVLSASESSRMVIELKHFEEAQRCIEEFMQDLPSLFDTIGRNKDAPVLAAMEKWVRASDWFTQGEFMKNFQNEMRSQDLMSAWKNIVAQGGLVYKVADKRTLYKFNSELQDRSKT